MNHPFLNGAMALAVDAGKSILSFYRSGDPLPVMTKQDRSPVTEADYSAHRVLAAGLPIQPPEEPAIEQHPRQVQRKRSRAQGEQ